jgi:hypothetical protein
MLRPLAQVPNQSDGVPLRDRDRYIATPQVDGLPYETEHRMRRSDAVYRRPIVFISTHADAVMRANALGAAVDRIPEMPFDNSKGSTLYIVRSEAS